MLGVSSVEQPAVSVVLPVRNAFGTLDDCLNSISKQSLPNFEVIIVDDGSTDRSVELVDAWCQRDPRIKLTVQPPLGIVAALNTGLNLAKGELIARMDADDIMYPCRLETQARYLNQNNSIDLVACQVELFPKLKIKSGYQEYIRWQNQCISPQQIQNDIYIESPLAHPSVMFRKSVVKKLGGYRAGNFPEDYELWLRMHRAGLGMAKIPQVLLKWRESDYRASRVDARYSRSSFDRLRVDYLSKDPRIASSRPLVFWGAGRKTRKRSNLLIQQGYKPTAWIDIDPNKMGRKFFDAEVVSSNWLRQFSSSRNKPFVLSYVANHGARDLIAHELHSIDFKLGRDYLMVG